MRPTIYLTEEERELCRKQRLRLHGTKGGNKPHIVLRVRDDGEVTVIYAYSRLIRQKKAPATIDVMTVGQTASDSDKVEYRNLRYYYIMGGYTVDSWDVPFDGNSWETVSVKWDGRGEPSGPVVNPEVLKNAAPMYRYAAIDEHSWGIKPAAYLRALRKYPAAELLHKADLDRLVVPTILNGGKELARFIGRNLETIKESLAGAETVKYAFSHGTTIEKASEICKARHKLAGVPLPPDTNASTVLEYIGRAGLTIWQFRNHAEHCRELNLAAGAYMPSPRRWSHRVEEVEALCAKKRQLEKQRAKETRAKRFAAAEGKLAGMLKRLRGTVKVVVPMTEGQLEKEGQAMANCIGNGIYAQSVANGRSLVVFLRMSDSPDNWCDVEFRKTGRVWNVAQCYGRKNTLAPEVARQTAKRICAMLTRRERSRKKAV